MSIEFSTDLEGTLTWDLPIKIAEALDRLPVEDREAITENLTNAMAAQANILLAVLQLNEELNNGFLVVNTALQKMANTVHMLS